MKNKKAFTLIELVSVLVILAILALIVTPLVLNIIRKTRTAADKRSIDAYGRSIELAITDYLLENGTFPTSIEELTIEYSGDRVVCETTQLNSDSSLYLAECTVNNRAVSNYTYGTDKTPAAPTYTAYNVGDEVTYNNVDYYVIKDSSTTEANVTLLKATPLTTAEVNTYGGVGTENCHVNMYVYGYGVATDCYHQSCDKNGYGRIAYYSSPSCGYDSNNNRQDSGCVSTYEDSEIKYVVDAWRLVQAPAASEARLITYDELENLGYGDKKNCGGNCFYNDDYMNVPIWVYNADYSYWTMDILDEASNNMWFVETSGSLSPKVMYNSESTVRPVIVLSKSAITN